MTRFSVFLPFMPNRPEQVLPYAAFVKHQNVSRLWQGQALVIEPHQLFTYLAGAGFRVPVGTGVTLTPLRHPMEAALHARSLAAITGLSVVAGFGPGATSLQEVLLGSPYGRPIQAAREYLTIVRGLLAGEAVAYQGDYFTHQGMLLPGLPAADVELALGVLRPQMARLAGEVADVAVTWLTPPHYLAEHIVPALQRGAEKAQRATPRLATVVPVALREPSRNPVELALASFRGHLQMPHYLDALQRAGVQVDPSDVEKSAQALVESGTFVFEDVAGLAESLDAYRAAGVDEVIVNVTGVSIRYGTKAALAELTKIFAGLPPLSQQ